MAILDTGCGEHEWLDDVVTKDIDLDGVQIGYHARPPTPRSSAT